MHHAGPYPASTDARTTSVGTASIQRFARPVCYQDMPETYYRMRSRMPTQEAFSDWSMVPGPERELRSDGGPAIIFQTCLV